MRVPKLHIFLLVATLAVSSACGPRSSSKGDISRERFVEVNVALRQIEPDSANAAELREAVLTEHRTTPDELRRFVAVRANDPDLLAEIWQEIADHLLEANSSDSSAAQRGDIPGPSSREPD